MDPTVEEGSEIVFFDVETTIPARQGEGHAILEFAAILVCPWTLVEMETYTTLVRPANPSILNSFVDRRNGITLDSVIRAPTFIDVAERVFGLLHGRIWAGHNILRFDCIRIREAFEEIGWPVPEPKGTIDSLTLLTQKFGKRAGNMKMATLATYFGLEPQTHRSLGDVRMNIEVVKNCAMVLFLESSSGYTGYLSPAEVSIPSIESCVQRGPGHFQSMKLLHRNKELRLFCGHLRVRFGISGYGDGNGHRRLNFVVDICPVLCEVLDACEEEALDRFEESGSRSKWWPLVKREHEFPTVRLSIPTTHSSINAEIYHKRLNGESNELEISRCDAADALDDLLKRGTFLDAYFSLDPYDYKKSAGVRLTVNKLIIIA